MKSVILCLKKRGVSILDGDYLSGKTTISIVLLEVLKMVSDQVKEERELAKQ